MNELSFLMCIWWESILASVTDFEGNTKMAESKIAKFKMADIIKLGENEWVWVRLN